MNILVTGGCGFIGSNLANTLARKGYTVHVIDNLSNGKLENIKENINRIIFWKGDITDKNYVDNIISQVDVIYHLAAQISVTASIKDPLKDAAVNIFGTLNILRAASNYRVKKVIYYSSAAVYGDPVYLPIDEKHPKNPSSPYGLSKLTAEKYAEFYSIFHGLNIVVIRPFNVYGPKQDPKSPYTGVISIFLDKALSGEDIQIYGDGGQCRDFIYVEDLVELSIKALSAKTPQFTVLNGACGEKTTIKSLAEKIKELTDSKSKIVHLPKREGEIYESYADITAAKQMLNFKPAYSLEEGLKKVIEYFKRE
ncbi:MAG: SDR family NAD(P)-dependent oxidoreductase [Candidatus Odinarchaeum yellowstonii]|uniref:SDR family NAD(P)-dependent oxidoreductase n=1 Tax=Odinarchaeota yellowstonii (strain LCB_4) TaxID=1841599 RepID=A0AAF0D222_ODILC|nr:MAG: SDR family NAD(P)-dependent oxidoreductase [Candidatus Odinarchaeum yellowstonii]